MSIRTKFVPLTVCVAFALAACGDDEKTDSTVTSAAPETSATDSPDTTVPDTATPETDVPDTSVESFDLVDISGEFLTDTAGMTLYVFTEDPVDGGVSNCYDSCATTWPPLVIPEGDFVLTLPEGFGEIPRDDGLSQLTYLGSPLYFYAGDSAPGDMNGEGIGGVWFVVNLVGV
jgi:predicted lipoprotein with Yx(FWY)xxD motif